MKTFLLIMFVVYVWIAFEMYRAPMMDENGRILRPGKKLKDLWQKQK